MTVAVSDLSALKPIELDAVESELAVQEAIAERSLPETVIADHDMAFANNVADRIGSLTAIAVKDVSARLAYQQNQAVKACEGLDFESEKNKIRGLQSEIRVSIRRDEDDLKYDFELFQRSLQYFDAYRSSRNLIAPAKRGEAFATVIAFLTLIVFVEAFLNAIFLAPVDPAGMVWGWITAVLISMVNVGVGFAVGSGSKLFNSIKVHAKALGILIAALGVPALLAFHYLVMKYRAEMSFVGEEIEAGGDYVELSALFERTWNSIQQSPFSVGDMISLIVFFVGIGAAVLAVRKGYTLGDKYPGYTSAQEQFEANRSAFIDRRNRHLDALQDLRDDVIGQIDAFIREADTGKTKALNWAQQSRSLLQSYRTFKASADAAVSQLIDRYVGDLKGREKTSVRKKLSDRIASAIAHDKTLEGLVADVCQAAEAGADDARRAREHADVLRSETIEAIDRQISDFKEKFDK